MKSIFISILALIILVSCSNKQVGSDAGENIIKIQDLNTKGKKEDLIVKDEGEFKEKIKNKVIDAINESSKDYYNVKSEIRDGIFVIHIYPVKEFQEEVIDVLSGEAKDANLDEWNKTVDDFKKASKTLSEKLGQNISLQIHNPLNEGNIIFSTSNEKVTYNISDKLYNK